MNDRESLLLLLDMKSGMKSRASQLQEIPSYQSGKQAAVEQYGKYYDSIDARLQTYMRIVSDYETKDLSGNISNSSM